MTRENDMFGKQALTVAIVAVVAIGAASFGGIMALGIVGAIGSMVILIVYALTMGNQEETAQAQIRELLSRPDHATTKLLVNSSGFLSPSYSFSYNHTIVAQWRDSLQILGEEYSVTESRKEIILWGQKARMATATMSKSSESAYSLGCLDGAFRVEAFTLSGFPIAIRNGAQLVGYVTPDAVCFPAKVAMPIAVFFFVVAKKIVRDLNANSAG